MDDKWIEHISLEIVGGFMKMDDHWGQVPILRSQRVRVLKVGIYTFTFWIDDCVSVPHEDSQGR